MRAGASTEDWNLCVWYKIKIPPNEKNAPHRYLRVVAYPLFFTIIFFATVGLQTFMGIFENRCRINSKPIDNNWEADSTVLSLCGYWKCPGNLTCGNPSEYNIPKNATEMRYPEINYGMNNFDTIWNSLFSVIHFINLTNWTNFNLVYWRSSHPAIVTIFTLSLTVILYCNF